MWNQHAMVERLDLPAPVEVDAPGNYGVLWHDLLDITEAQPDGWTLVGGLMITLLCEESGQPHLRATEDIDGIVQVRGVSDATESFSRLLRDLGWDIPDDHVKGTGTGFRFKKKKSLFDLLAPEGLGSHGSLTTLPPLGTIEIPGGTQALSRTQLCPVSVNGRTGWVPRPNLLGAIVIKSCAAVEDKGGGDKDPARHVDDLAHLYARIPDPLELRGEMRTKDRKRMAAAPEPNWTVVGDAALAASGRAARNLLLNPS